MCGKCGNSVYSITSVPCLEYIITFSNHSQMCSSYCFCGNKSKCFSFPDKWDIDKYWVCFSIILLNKGMQSHKLRQCSTWKMLYVICMIWLCCELQKHDLHYLNVPTSSQKGEFHFFSPKCLPKSWQQLLLYVTEYYSDSKALREYRETILQKVLFSNFSSCLISVNKKIIMSLYFHADLT